MRICNERPEQCILPIIGWPFSGRSLLGEARLNSIPQLLIDNRLMLSRMGGALVHDHATIDQVLEKPEQAAPPERDAPALRAAHPVLDLGANAVPPQCVMRAFADEYSI